MVHDGAMSQRAQRITSRNATFQQWQSLLSNRTKRFRHGEFMVQGVRPISLALQHDWDVRALLRPIGGRPSSWAQQAWDTASGARYELAGDLLAELADREAGEAPELVAVLAMPADELDRLRAPDPLITVFDRPTQPGNIGTLLRSIDAFGGTGLIVCGHGADPYDPKAVRASTGSSGSPIRVRRGPRSLASARPADASPLEIRSRNATSLLIVVAP